MRYFLFFAAAILLAQDATFKIESNLVVVNVAVRDRNGAPITNLKKEDFVLLEDGIPQSLAVFELDKLDNELLTPLSFTSNSPRTAVERVPETAPGASVTAPV